VAQPVVAPVPPVGNTGPISARDSFATFCCASAVRLAVFQTDVQRPSIHRNCRGNSTGSSRTSASDLARDSSFADRASHGMIVLFPAQTRGCHFAWALATSARAVAGGSYFASLPRNYWGSAESGLRSGPRLCRPFKFRPRLCASHEGISRAPVTRVTETGRVLVINPLPDPASQDFPAVITTARTAHHAQQAPHAAFRASCRNGRLAQQTPSSRLTLNVARVRLPKKGSRSALRWGGGDLGGAGGGGAGEKPPPRGGGGPPKKRFACSNSGYAHLDKSRVADAIQRHGTTNRELAVIRLRTRRRSCACRLQRIASAMRRSRPFRPLDRHIAVSGQIIRPIQQIRIEAPGVARRAIARRPSGPRQQALDQRRGQPKRPSPRDVHCKRHGQARDRPAVRPFRMTVITPRTDDVPQHRPMQKNVRCNVFMPPYGPTDMAGAKSSGREKEPIPHANAAMPKGLSQWGWWGLVSTRGRRQHHSANQIGHGQASHPENARCPASSVR